MKTIWLLTMAAVVAGMASCSSSDEFVSNSQNGESQTDAAGKAISLVGYNNLSKTRALSSEIPAGNTDFAASTAKAVKVFYQENASATEFLQNYNASGYNYTALKGGLTFGSGQDQPYWSWRTQNTAISCYAFYPSDIVNASTFLATTSTTASTGKGVGWDGDYLDDELIAQVASSTQTTANDKVASFVAPDGYNTKMFFIKTDQSTLANYLASDVYFGYPNANKTVTMERPEETANHNSLQFHHAGSKVTVNLVAETATDAEYYTAAQLATAKVELLNWPIAGIIYYDEKEGGSLEQQPFLYADKNSSKTYTDAAGRSFPGITDWCSVGTVITATNAIGTGLSCSAILPAQFKSSVERNARLSTKYFT